MSFLEFPFREYSFLNDKITVIKGVIGLVVRFYWLGAGGLVQKAKRKSKTFVLGKRVKSPTHPYHHNAAGAITSRPTRQDISVLIFMNKSRAKVFFSEIRGGFAAPVRYQAE